MAKTHLSIHSNLYNISDRKNDNNTFYGMLINSETGLPIKQVEVKRCHNCHDIFNIDDLYEPMFRMLGVKEPIPVSDFHFLYCVNCLDSDCVTEPS